MRGHSGDDLSEWVKSGRKSNGWTQVQLAVLLGVTTVHLSKIENGHAEVKLSTLRKLCGIFRKPFVVDEFEPKASWRRKT